MGIDQIELKQIFEDNANNYRFVFFRLEGNVTDAIPVEKTVQAMLINKHVDNCEVITIFDTESILFDEYHELRRLNELSGEWDDDMKVPFIDRLKDEDDPYREGEAILFVFMDADEETGLCIASTRLVSLDEIGGTVFRSATPANPRSEAALSILERMNRFQTTIIENRSEKLKDALVIDRDSNLTPVENSRDETRISAQTAMKMLGVPKSTFYRHVNEGRLNKHYDDPENQRRSFYIESEILDLKKRLAK